MIVELPKQDMIDTLRIRFPYVMLFIISLPAVGMFTCLFTSIIIHWEETTSSHCGRGITNYLPSLSSSTGKQPEKFIWQISIALHCSPRIFLVSPMIYYQLISGMAASKLLSLTVSFIHVFENVCLVILTLVSSTENYPIHRNSFIGFLAASMLYMIIVCSVSYQHNLRISIRKNTFSLKMKSYALGFYIFSFISAMYFFARHNWYCEPGIYSVFCFFEYCIILTNIFFHGTFAWDMKDASVFVAPNSMSSNNILAKTT